MRTHSIVRNSAVIAALLFFLGILQSFSQSAYTPDAGNVGLPISGTFQGTSIETVQLNNGNLHIDIPLLHLPGIGMDTDIHLTFDNQVWGMQSGPYNGNNTWRLLTMSRLPWQTKDAMAGYLKWGQHSVAWNCYPNVAAGAGNSLDFDFMSFKDEDGTAHTLPVTGMVPYYGSPLCSATGETGGWPNVDANGNYPVYSLDSSGYNLIVNNKGAVVSLKDKHGATYGFSGQPSGEAPGFVPPTSGGGGTDGTGTIVNPAGPSQFYYQQVTSVEDSNGNKISSGATTAVQNGATVVTGVTLLDTIGRTITEGFTPSPLCSGPSGVSSPGSQF